MIYEDHELVTLMEDIINPFDSGGRYLTEEERTELKEKYIKENSLILGEDFLNSIIIDADDITIKSQKFKQGVLLEEDKSLLIEYVPKLFDTLLETKTEIMYKMFELVNHVWKFRLYNDPHFMINRMRDNFPTKYENDLPQKNQALINSIDTVLELMGGDLDAEGDTELKTQLREVRKNPSKHIPKKPPSPKKHAKYVSLTTIRKYLSSLNLDKQKVVDEFIDKLEEI